VGSAGDGGVQVHAEIRLVIGGKAGLRCTGEHNSCAGADADALDMHEDAGARTAGTVVDGQEPCPPLPTGPASTPLSSISKSSTLLRSPVSILKRVRPLDRRARGAVLFAQQLVIGPKSGYRD